jgi:hypothetical protein
LSINFEEILSRAHGNFEEQNKVLEPSIININYCIIINAYYNYIINAKDKYCTSDQGLPDECDMEEKSLKREANNHYTPTIVFIINKILNNYRQSV